MDTPLESGRRSSTSVRLKPAPVFTHPVTFHYEIQNHTTRMQKLTHAFRVYRLMVLTLICVVAGIFVGLICRPFAKNWPERYFMYIEFPGELYLRFLKLLIIPLLVSNVLLSFGTIQGKISSKLGKAAGMLYLCSNLIAITVAILCAISIRPGGIQKNLEMPGANPSGKLASPASKDNHLASQQDESISRYRDYHPMYYHTNKDTDTHNGLDSSNLVRLVAFEGTRRRREVLLDASGDELGARIEPMGANQSREVAAAAATAEEEEEEEIMIELDDNGGEISSESGQDEESNSDLGQLIIDNELASHLIKTVRNDKEVVREINRIGLSTKLPIDVVLDVLRNLLPDSIIGATLRQTRTKLFTPNELRIEKNGSTNPAPNRWPMGHEVVDQPNVIGLLAMSVLTGVVLSHMGEASKPLLDLCSCISELSLRIGMKAIHMAPFCIMFLLIGQVSRARDLSSIAGELMMYSLTVIIALFIHSFFILPLIYYAITKKSPLAFFKGMLEALVASFATSSSSSTMALMLNCLTGLNLNLVIVRAFGPLGSVFNMNGTCIYEAIAVIFIAQTLGIKLPLTSLLLVGLCSAVASLSTSGIPSSGMMTMVIVMNAINLPVLELSLVYIVDFIIDRFRTVVNVWSGAIVCGIIDHICPEELFEDEMKPEKYREMVKYRASRGSLSGRKSLSSVEDKPQVISVIITPPSESSKI